MLTAAQSKPVSAPSIPPASGSLRSLRRRTHSVWVFVQQFGVKAVLAVKFFWVAKTLGPGQFGTAGMALLLIAILEGLTDTGFAQAIVQGKREPTKRQAGALWLLQCGRGIAICLVLALSATFVARLLGLPELQPLLLLAAVVPLLRSAANPGVYIRQRARDFRTLSVYELTAAVVDLATTAALIYAGTGPAAMVLGVIAGESCKLALNWTVLRVNVTLRTRLTFVERHLRYARWIWSGSILITLLNNFDKVIVAKLLGAADFGLYQVAGRASQLLILDPAMAVGQYLFPTVAARLRESREHGVSSFWSIFYRVAALAFAVCLAATAGGHSLLMLVGEDWSSAAEAFRILLAAAFFGALNAMFVAFGRALGRPRITVGATLLQLVVLCAVCPALIYYFGIRGASIAAVLGVMSACGWLFWTSRKLSRHVD